jgi:hypothetical protein
MTDTPVTILVNREKVLAKDASRVRRVLDSFVPLFLEKNRNNVAVLVTGYNDDKRELCQIPEVRTWFHSLFDITPDLFYWMSDHTELFKQFSDNPSFQKWLDDTIFGVTYQSTTQIGAG